MYRLILYLFVWCVHVLNMSSAQPCPKCDADIDKTIKEALACKSNLNRTVGLAVSVVQSDRVLFSRGFGYMDKVTKNPVTGDTVFQVASVSKAFAVLLLVKMMEEKTRYTLDTKLKDIFGRDDIFIDEVRSNYATLRDIIAHRMGIPRNNEMRFDDKLKRSNVIDRLKYLEPTREFRGSYIYNPPMYGFITYIAEVFGGDKWENLIKRYIFDPLGMSSSTLATVADLEKIKLATGYVEYYGELFGPVPHDFTRQYGEFCGSVCIMTTSDDMTNWARLFLNGGKLPNGTRLISENAFKEITTPVNYITNSYTEDYFSKPKLPVTNIQNGYAHGWRVGYYRGYKMYVHSGSTWGYRAMISWYPDADLGIFVAFTGNDPDFLFRLTLHNYIFDSYRGFKPYLNSSTMCSYPEPWITAKPQQRNPNHPKNLELTRKKEEYVGMYHNNAYGTMEVKGHEDASKLTLNYGYTSFLLYPSSMKDVFYGEPTGITKYLFEIQQFKFSFDANQATLQPLSFGEKPVFNRQDKSNDVHSLNVSRFMIMFVLIALVLIF